MNSIPNDELPAEAAKAVPLVQAFRDHADPKLRAEYHETKERLQREGKWQYIGTPQNIESYLLSEFDGHGHELLGRSRELVAMIHAQFIERLCGGNLTAWAREGSPLAPWREIPKLAWMNLKLDDVAKGTAKGPGVALFDLRVGPHHVEPPESIERGRRGRPSSEPFVIAEFRRRVAAGEPDVVLRVEAAILAAWLRRTHPDETPAKAKSIEEMIRSEFNAWKTACSKATRQKMAAKPSPEPNGPWR